MEASTQSDARERDHDVRAMNGTKQVGQVPSREDAIVVGALTEHAPALLRTALRHSLCADDAQDAYQRALEILLRRAGSLDPERAIRWLHVVIKHEAMAVRQSRQELVDTAVLDLVEEASSNAASPEERAIGWEHTTRAAEALKRLKPQERKALWLKAAGLSYAEIAARESWTYTKVNRCLAEGRKSFLERYTGIESGVECERWAPVLSALVDGEATPSELAEVRPHLRNCQACQATVRELHTANSSVAAVIPIGVVGAGAASPLNPGNFCRVWDAVWSTVGERSTAVAFKAQMAADSLGASKVAAVAATTVAVVSGGAAVVETTHGGTEPKKLSQPASSVSTASQLQPTSSRVRRITAARVGRGSHLPEFKLSIPVADSEQIGAEFGPEQSASAPPSVRPPSSTQPSHAQNGTEFDP